MAAVTLIFFLLAFLPLSIFAQPIAPFCPPLSTSGFVTSCAKSDNVGTPCSSIKITVGVRNNTGGSQNIRVRLCFLSPAFTISNAGDFTQSAVSCRLNVALAVATNVVSLSSNAEQYFDCDFLPMNVLINESDFIYFLEVGGVVQNAWRYRYIADNALVAVNGITTPVNISDVFTPADIAGFCNYSNPNAGFILNMVLSGTLLIDTPFCVLNPQAINRSHITMNNGSRIIVQANQSLTINNADIENSCDNPQMWESIIVESGASLTLNNCKIRDGFRAISVEDGGSLSATGCLFQDNYESVYTNPTGSPQNISLGQFGTCTFEGTGNLLSWQGSYIGSYPYAGIEINNVSQFYISPTPYWYPAKFRNMENGILSNFSNSYIYRGEFQDLSSVALFGRGSSSGFYIGNSGNSQPLYINNCGVGVQLYSIGYSGVNNININANTGIFAILNNALFSYIQNNTISGKIGLRSLWSNMGSNSFANNLIYPSHWDPSVSYGILGNEMSWTGSWNINRNYIEQYSASNGIRFSSGTNTTLEKNTVYMTSSTPSSAIGINMSGNTSDYITCNWAGGENYQPPFSFRKGFQFYASNNNFIGNNTAANTETGTHFLNWCIGTDFRTNHFLTHTVGLLLESDATIGQQNFKGNTWLTNHPYAYGAKHNSTDQGVVSASEFRYEPNSSRPELYPPNVNPASWFVPDPNGTSPYYYCSPNLRPTGTTPQSSARLSTGGGTTRQVQDVQAVALDAVTESDDNLDLELNKRIIDDQSVLSNTFPNSAKSIARKQLYEKFNKNPNSTRNRGDYQRFVQKMNQGAIGQLFGVREQLKTLFDYSATDKETMLQNFNKMEVRGKEVAALEEEIDRATDARTRATLKARHKEGMKEIHELDKVNDRIVKSYTDVRNRKLDALERDNERVVANALPEINEKTVNAIALQTVARGKAKFDDTQIATLRRIASQCPAEGGDAVFQARSMYAYVSEEQFDDARLCPQTREENFALTQRVASSTDVFKMVPNPVANQLTITCPTKKATNYKGQILNSLGVSIKTFNLVEGNNQIDMQDLSEGVYIISIFVNDKKVDTQKIVKLKNH